MSPIVVVQYDPVWPAAFDQLHRTVWPAISDLAMSIEHVGSTSVPGLAAKPVIDLSVVVPSVDDVPRAIEKLARLGYVHSGNLGVDGREAFQSPHHAPRHHLYLCPHGGLALRNHLAVRDHLRAHPEDVARYGALKLQLAARYPDDIAAYTEGKTDVILQILEAAGFRPDELDSIAGINRRQPAEPAHPSEPPG
jgi:GrpB-like predicted nucleotidyltransferase (UPF0157 family)